jgi:hypothetical protein
VVSSQHKEQLLICIHSLKDADGVARQAIMKLFLFKYLRLLFEVEVSGFQNTDTIIQSSALVGCVLLFVTIIIINIISITIIIIIIIYHFIYYHFHTVLLSPLL